MNTENIFSKIIGIGSFAPEEKLTNEDLEKIVNTSDEWIQKRTGIKERRRVSKDMATSDLAVEAAKSAINMANINVNEIDTVILGTAFPDYMFPSTACLVQKKLDIKNAFAYDLNAGCTGFIYGLMQADSFIKSGKIKTALVIGAEVITKFLNWQDRTSCVLFGDGAGAVILQANNKPGIIDIRLKSDGSFADLLYMPAGGSKLPASFDTVTNNLHTVHLKGKEVFKIAVNSLYDLASELLEKNNIKSSEIDFFIPHQANKRIINAVVEKLGLNNNKVFINIHKYGNTSAASIPIAIDEAYKNNILKQGHKILITAFGAGFTWGGAIIEL